MGKPVSFSKRRENGVYMHNHIDERDEREREMFVPAFFIPSGT